MGLSATTTTQVSPSWEGFCPDITADLAKLALQSASVLEVHMVALFEAVIRTHTTVPPLCDTAFLTLHAQNRLRLTPLPLEMLNQLLMRGSPWR
jgi:hypothetical protein